MVTAKTDAEAPATKEEIPHDHLFKVTGLSSTNLEKMDQVSEPSDFEAAIAATGYGRFNVGLMLCVLPAFWSAVSVTSSVSYIFTRAKCDMNLSLLDMGTITGITYGGAISSAMVWGFLSDTLGRRRIMAWGFFSSGVVEIVSAMSQNFAMLLLMRFLGGFLFNGPFAVLISYIAEMHRTELRARILLLSNLFYTVANITLPLLAWAFLTQEWHFEFYGFVIRSWNLFLLATSLVPLMTGVAFFFLPESPKFLMSRGRNEEAMQIFRKIFSMNTRKLEEEFPITKLVEEKSEEQARGLAALRGGVEQLRPLFRPTHAKWLLLCSLINMGSMFGSNTVRLWYPQLAAMIGSANGTLCAAIAADAPADEACVPTRTDMLTYLQSALVGTGSVVTYGVGGVVINKCGKKVVLVVCAFCSGALVVLVPLLGHGALSVAALVTAVLAFTALFAGAMSSVTVELFPTSLRVMAMATFLMCGRLGTISGTVAFPALMSYGCLPPFFTIAAVLGICGLASCLLPNTTLKKLQ